MVFVPVSTTGQIALTNDAFPSVGDTFLISTDRLPTQIDLGTAGPLKSWDFTTLQSPFAQRSLLLPYENRTGIKELNDAESLMTGISGNDKYYI